MKLKCKLIDGYNKDKYTYGFIFKHKQFKIDICIKKEDIKKIDKLIKNRYYVIDGEFEQVNNELKCKSEYNIVSYQTYIYNKYKPEVIEYNTENNVKSNNYKLYNYPFDFNPAQTKMFPYIFEDKNMIICSPTASGKTVMAEITAGLILKMGFKVIYLSPLKALGEEKYVDWGDEKHFFSNYKLSILTGDYALTETRKKELNEANIICMTSEMLDSKTIMYKDNIWLDKVGLIIVDEFHLIAVKGRGDKLETALMRFFQFNKISKFLGLSATLPNIADNQKWIEKLTSKKTELIISDYRPCKLDLHYVEYQGLKNNYMVNQSMIMGCVFQIINQNINDKYLIFVSSKSFGRNLEDEFLKRRMNNVAFHNADKDKTHRNKIENEFKDSNGKVQYLISTSSLAWGVNLPSRRVIICHTEIGRNDISVFDIQQMCGRAGRPKYDSKGDAYIICSSDKKDYHRDRITRGELIQSQLCDVDVLEFHILGEIYNGTIYDIDSFKIWYKKSLAYIQNRIIDDKWIHAIFNNLSVIGMIEEINKKYRLTSLGRISVMLYFYPRDVYSWKKSFSNLFKNGNEDDDISLSKALSERDIWSKDYISKDEKNYINDYVNQLQDKTLTGSLKYGAAIWKMITGRSLTGLYIYSSAIFNDIERILSLLKLVDKWVCKWDKDDFFDTLSLRIKYGISKDLIELVKIKGIGKVYATEFAKYDIKKKSDLLIPSNYTVVKMILKGKTDKILDIIRQII